MEKISVTPKIRGLGNIVSVKSSDDFRGYNTLISSGTDTVDGKSLTVYQDYFQASPKLSLSYDKHIDPLSTSFTVSATLETHSDSAISGVTLYCDVNGTVQSGTTDSGGVVSFSIDLVDDVVKYEGLVYFMGTSGIARISQGFTVYALLPDSLSLFGNKSVIQSDDSVDFIATVLDEEDVGVPNVTVYFFEEYTPALRASASASVIQSGDDLDIYCTLIDADDGSIVREPNVDVYFYNAIEAVYANYSEVTRNTTHGSTIYDADMSVELPTNCTIYFDVWSNNSSTSSEHRFFLMPKSQWVSTADQPTEALFIDLMGSDKAQFGKRESNATSYFAQNISCTGSTYHTIKIVKTGTTLKFYIDDDLKTTQTVSWIDNHTDYCMSMMRWSSTGTSKLKNVEII